jgi:formamidopyrimidine-DNA glycosylase
MIIDNHTLKMGLIGNPLGHSLSPLMHNRTLADMAVRGGRDTEKDLFGKPGGYKTKASKLTVGNTCPVCGGSIRKESYMGGSIYYCDQCQRI